jgi:hypothetical protein
MFHDNGESISLTDEQFFAEMQRRKEKLKWSKNDVIVGCPLCNSDPIPVTPNVKDKKKSAAATPTGAGGQ